MTFSTEEQARHFFAQLTQIGKITNVVVIPTTHGHWTVTHAKALREPVKVCSICGETFTEFSNNARPINDGRCCAYCDDHVVIPARIAEVA